MTGELNKLDQSPNEEKEGGLACLDTRGPLFSVNLDRRDRRGNFVGSS